MREGEFGLRYSSFLRAWSFVICHSLLVPHFFLPPPATPVATTRLA